MGSIKPAADAAGTDPGGRAALAQVNGSKSRRICGEKRSGCEGSESIGEKRAEMQETEGDDGWMDGMAAMADCAEMAGWLVGDG
jgi:hypothetical protein